MMQSFVNINSKEAGNFSNSALLLINKVFSLLSLRSAKCMLIKFI